MIRTRAATLRATVPVGWDRRIMTDADGRDSGVLAECRAEANDPE